MGAVDQPWLESDRFAAFVSVGALVSGWSLIATKRHVLNLADDYANPEFAEFVDRTVSAVERSYGPAVVFEHGSQEATSTTSCGTAHAHLHVVPLSFSLVARARAYDRSLKWQACGSMDLADRVGSREYLFVADKVESGIAMGDVAVLSGSISQFFRRIIAQELGRPKEFDYRIHPQMEIAEASAAALSTAQKQWANAA